MRSKTITNKQATLFSGEARAVELKKFIAQASLRGLSLPVPELLEAVGVSEQDLGDRETLERVAERVKDMLEVVDYVSEWAGGRTQALAWYLEQPIAALGGKTPQVLINEGKIEGLREYLEHIAVGGYA